MTHSCGKPHAWRERRDPMISTRGAASTPGWLERELPKEAGGALRTPKHDEIAALAYSYWERRGRSGGSPWEDWFRAERELKSGTTR